MKFYVTGVLAIMMAGGVARNAQAKKEDEVVVLTGCVQGFAQGGDEIKAFTGKWVEVAGHPSDFSWDVTIRTADDRTLKTGSVFTVKVLKDHCSQLP